MIIETIGVVIIVGFALFVLWYLSKKSNINENLYELLPNIFPSLGILGTFVGIAYGLSNFEMNSGVEKMSESISNLLEGLTTAFYVSIVGVFLLIVFSIYSSVLKKKNKVFSEETQAINELKDVLIEIRDNFTFLDESDNKVKISNIIRDTFKESKKQTELLQVFSADLALKIEAGFEKILNNPNEGVTHELKKLKSSIDNLGNKLQDPTTEMTQNVVKELKDSMAKMVEEFKTSMSGNTKSELEKLSSLMSNAGQSLNSFPERLEVMMASMNSNFKVMQDVFENISNQTVAQSQISTENMKNQISEISEIVKSQVGNLQEGQSKLIHQQSQNISISEQLVDKYNKSVDKMSDLTNKMNGTLDLLHNSQSEMKVLASNLKIISELSINSVSNLSTSQSKLIDYSFDFIDKNNNTISEINNTMNLSKEISADYANKFSLIQNGLVGIFSEIQNGLDNYKNAITTSTGDYLAQYTTVLTKTIESLNGILITQKSILDELDEQLKLILENKK